MDFLLLRHRRLRSSRFQLMTFFYIQWPVAEASWSKPDPGEMVMVFVITDGSRWKETLSGVC